MAASELRIALVGIVKRVAGPDRLSTQRALRIAVVAVVFGAACSGPSYDEVAEQSDETSTSMGERGSVVDGIGQNIDIDATEELSITGVLPSGTRLVVDVAEVASLAALPEGYEMVGEPVSINVEGPTPREVNLDLVFGTDGEAEGLVVGHLSDAGTWEIYRPDLGESMRWSTSDFSVFAMLMEAVTDGWRSVESFGDSIADSLTGATDPPEDCDLTGSQGLEWASHTGSPGVGLVHVCARNRSDGRFEIVFKSNSSAPVEVNVPNQSDVDWIWQEGASDYASLVLSTGLSSENSRMLAPGREMTIGWSRPEATPDRFDFWFSQTSEAMAISYLADAIGTNINGIAALMVFCVGLNNVDSELTDHLNVLNLFKECARDNVLNQLYDAAISNGGEAAFRELAQVAAARFQRRPEMVTANLSGVEQFLARNRVFSARSINRLVLLADLSIDLAGLGPIGLSSAFGSDEAFLSSVILDGYCPQPGPVVDGVVTGVETSLTLRADPSTGAREIAQLPAGSQVRYLPGSTVDRDGRSWVSVMHPDGRSCGSAAAEYIARSGSGAVELTEASAWDRIKNAEIPGFCMHAPTRLVDGIDSDPVASAEHPGGDPGYFNLNRESLVYGLSSPVGPLIAIGAVCSAGGVGWGPTIMFFTSDGTFYNATDLTEADWESINLQGPGRGAVQGLTVDGSQLYIELAAYDYGDAGCCASASAVLSVAIADDGSIAIISLSTDATTDLVESMPRDPEILRDELIQALGSNDDTALARLTSEEAFEALDVAVPEQYVSNLTTCTPENGMATCDIAASDAPVVFVLTMSETAGGWIVSSAEFVHTS